MSGIGLWFQQPWRTSLKRASSIGLANKAEVWCPRWHFREEWAEDSKWPRWRNHSAAPEFN